MDVLEALQQNAFIAVPDVDLGERMEGLKKLLSSGCSYLDTISANLWGVLATAVGRNPVDHYGSHLPIDNTIKPYDTTPVLAVCRCSPPELELRPLSNQQCMFEIAVRLRREFRQGSYVSVNLTGISPQLRRQPHLSQIVSADDLLCVERLQGPNQRGLFVFLIDAHLGHALVGLGVPLRDQGL